MCHKRSDQTASGVFFIGLALLFLVPGLGFWPGIMFVIGASAITRDVTRGEAWHRSGGLWPIGIGLLFTFGFSWPLLLIFIGLSMLVGKSRFDHHGWGGDDDWKAKREPEKAKNDKRKNDEDYEEIEWRGDFV